MNDDIFIPDADAVMRYQAQVLDLLKSNGSRTETIDMGRLPEIYTILGIADKQLKTNGKTILKALGLEGRNKHNVPMETVGNLLSLTYDPEAVFKSLSVSNNPGAYIAVLNAKTENQEQIIAILSPSKDGQGFTFIPSVYEKHNFDRFLGRIYEEQKILYVKNKGSEIWGQLQSLPRHKSEPSNINIPTKNDIVKQISNKEQIMEKRTILAKASEELTPKQMALFAKDVDYIEASLKAEEQQDWNRVDQLLKERSNQPDAIKSLRTNDYKQLMSAWEKEARRESKQLSDHLAAQKKLDHANQLINEKAEVQADGSLRISLEDWRGINRKLNEKNIEKNKLFENAIRNIASETPPLEKRNINSKENFMSENTYYPKANRPSKEDEAVFHKALHERKVIMEALKNGTLSCLPGTDGYADTAPALNLMSDKNYHGDTLLYIKEHQKQNGYPTAEYITEHQIEKAKQDYPEIALKEDQKPVSFYINELNKETQEYEPKEIQVFNIAQTTNPQLLKDWVIEQEEKKIESMKTQFSESYKPSEPKQKSPAPESITCTSTDPEKYLGQYLAAVSLNSKFKVSPEQAAEFTQKLENSVYERSENGRTHPFKLSKISNKANEECRNILRDIKMDNIKQQREQTPQQQEQTQSRGRSM